MNDSMDSGGMTLSSSGKPRKRLPQENGQPTAHDWEHEKRKYAHKSFYDDGTMSFFWRAHTITVLVIFSCCLFYVALLEPAHLDSEYNTRRGLVAVVLTFVLFGVTHTPDGPFRRPHPAFWRLILCLSIVYELALVFLLFQTPEDARALLKNIDEELGVPLPEKDYGGNCLLYDPDVPDDPFHNIVDKLDGFVVVHFFGWWLKTLILRDWWLCMVISIMFEVMEYTLEHQLPNFSECWWDHWLMDGLICNSGGIYLGMKTLDYLRMKPYHWRGMWNIPTYSGKITRVLKQFTPYSWTDFNWKPTSSLKRWIAMLGIIGFILLAELNTFYLKTALWISPPHFLCMGRLWFILFIGAVAIREAFQYLDDPNCKKLGNQMWLAIVIFITEVLIILKFEWEIITKPLPSHMMAFWSILLFVLVSWTLWHFYLQRLLWHSEQKHRQRKMSAIVGSSGGKIENNNIKHVETNGKLNKHIDGSSKNSSNGHAPMENGLHNQNEDTGDTIRIRSRAQYH